MYQYLENRSEVEPYSEQDLYFAILSDCDSCKKFFETIYKGDKYRKLYRSFWENHREGDFYKFNRLYPENSTIPFSFLQSIILLDQIRRTEEQVNIYEVEGFAERLDRLKSEKPIIFPANSVSFLSEENRRIVGLGSSNDEEQKLLDHNISECANLAEYIYSYRLSSEQE